MNERSTKRSGPIGWILCRSRRFWITVAVILPLLYIASLGPACWLVGDLKNPDDVASDAVPVVYYPLLWLARITRSPIAPGVFEPSQVDDWIEWYSTLGRSDGASPVLLPNGERTWMFKSPDLPQESDTVSSP
jgi:hypothetical protein